MVMVRAMVGVTVMARVSKVLIIIIIINTFIYNPTELDSHRGLHSDIQAE